MELKREAMGTEDQDYEMQGETVRNGSGFGGFVKRNWKTMALGVAVGALGFLVGRKSVSATEADYYYEDEVTIEDSAE